ncbi:LysR family transcriptional regulator [Nostocoides sp. HKS02]|uniref:LysR family transcriptional regulator n=1 Tax=Nostocoides sp. HKS02 TaxID=1813880 RepID=UPI0012B4CE55|nr:LysR substrate-binding domain-containing protein [Tetrasphaera sp. HKS02]QGN58835.1 LysR family transcriptional regulator [Tetrasphaera sp. HKS02]
MELRHLEHFLAVAEERSFTRAAARLHLVQSALSVSVRSLERELGSQLFDRTTHSVQLTDAGTALVVEARRTLAAAEAARDAVAAVKGGLRGSVHVGIMHSLALIDLAALLTRYHREYPDVRLVPRPAQGGSADLARDVQAGKLDLALASLPTGHPKGVNLRTLASEEMLLACPPGHPLARRRRIALTELDGETFVDNPPGWGTRVSVDRLFAESGLQREITVEVGDIPTVSELVRSGFGFAFVSPSTLPNPRRLVLRRVRPHPQFVVSLVTPTRPVSAAAHAFIDMVRESFPKPA